MEFTVQVKLNAPIQNVWKAWTNPKDIEKWNFATEEWHCPRAEIDLQVGGNFSYRMESKDGITGFEFSGVFTRVEKGRVIEFRLDDSRRVKVEFEPTKDGLVLSETFEAEKINDKEMQKNGWQSILDNFKSYVENQ